MKIKPLGITCIHNTGINLIDRNNMEKTLRDEIAIAAMLRELEAQNKELTANIESADRGKQYAYYERNMLVGALSKLFPAHIEFHPEGDESWDKEWRNIIMIELPTGQASWHIHDSELNNFAHLKHAKGNSWDGHCNDIKYARLNALEARKEKDNA